MATLKWDATGQRKVENGVSKGVLYPLGKSGVAWNGLTAVSEKTTGGEIVELHADNHRYGSFRTYDEFEATIEAYTYPEEFAECDGSVTVADGVKIGQQRRRPFDFCYRTEVYTDAENHYDHEYRIHLIYNATASPSERNYKTLNDSPEAIQFSWDLQCMPFSIKGRRAASTIILDSRAIDRIKLEALEKILYGHDDVAPRMPSPEEIVKLIQRLDLHRIFMDVFARSGDWIWDTFNFREDTVPIAIDREAERHIYNEPASGTEYIKPAIAYSLLSESDDGVRTYMVIVVDTVNPSSHVAELKTKLDLHGEEIIKSGDSYYYTYTLDI